MDRRGDCEEDCLYDSILDAYEHAQLGMDFAVWEGLSYVELVQILNEDRIPNTDAIRNSILLILALFSRKKEGIDLFGEDIGQLSPSEQAKVFKKVRAALF